MPAGGTTETPGTGLELPNDMPSLVLGNGGTLPYADVNFVTDSSDILVPSVAEITIRANSTNMDQTTWTSIDPASPAMPPANPIYGRVQLQSSVTSQTTFLGNLIKPRREWSDKSDQIVLSYEDDRCFLRKMPMRGCLVWDSQTQALKFITGMEPRINPEGYQNATPVQGANGANGTCWVFTETAAQGTYGQSDDKTIGSEQVTSGQAAAWTPLRWLSYCWLYFNFIVGSQAGAPSGGATASTNWVACNGAGSKRLFWPSFSIDTNGSSSDYLNRKMPDKSFKGCSMAQALHYFEEICGVYGLKVVPGQNGQSNIISYAKHAAVAVQKKQVYVQKSGTPAFNSLISGMMGTDATDFVVGTLVEGGRPRIESTFVYWPLGATISDNNLITSDIIPAWTAAEELGFMSIAILAINANTGTAIPGLAAGTPEALSAARTSYPRVFRCFCVNIPTNYNRVNKIMRGYQAGTTMLNDFPYLALFRPLEDNQLQPYLETTALKRANDRCPIRTTMTWNAATTYGSAPGTNDLYDMQYNNGCRVEKDGLIYFDGATDDVTNVLNCIYTNPILGYAPVTAGKINNADPTYPSLRYLQINLAVAHDGLPGTLLSLGDTGSGAGPADPNSILQEIDPAVVQNATNGPQLMHYVQNSGFRTEHQVQSFPALDRTLTTATIDSNTGKVTTGVMLKVPAGTGINKELRSDASQMGAHAARRHMEFCKLKRVAKFVLPGVQYQYDSGDFVDFLVGSDGTKLKVNDYIKSVQRDYASKQTTTLAFGDVGNAS